MAFLDGIADSSPSAWREVFDRVRLLLDRGGGDLLWAAEGMAVGAVRETGREEVAEVTIAQALVLAAPGMQEALTAAAAYFHCDTTDPRLVSVRGTYERLIRNAARGVVARDWLDSRNRHIYETLMGPIGSLFLT